MSDKIMATSRATCGCPKQGGEVSRHFRTCPFRSCDCLRLVPRYGGSYGVHVWRCIDCDADWTADGVRPDQLDYDDN